MNVFVLGTGRTPYPENQIKQTTAFERPAILSRSTGRRTIRSVDPRRRACAMKRANALHAALCSGHPCPHRESHRSWTEINSG